MTNYTWMTTTALSATAADFGQEVMDNHFDKNTTMAAIKKYGGIVDKAGGAEFTVPILKAAGIPQWFTRTTKLNDTTPDPATTLNYDMTYVQVPVKIYWIDEVENGSSKAKIFDFVKTQKEVTQMTLDEELEAALWRAVPLANSMHSLPEIVDATASLGGLDPASASYWAAYTATSSSFASNGISTMQSCLTQLYIRKANTDVIFQGATVYDYFITHAEDSHLLMNDGSKLGFGIGKVPFVGIPMEISGQCPSGEQYWLDLSTIKIRRNSRANGMSDWIELENEAAKKAHLRLALQAYCQVRRKNAKLTISAA